MVALVCQLGLHHLKAWLGLQDPLPKWIIQMAGKSVLAIGWVGEVGVSVPLPVCLTQDCSSTLLAWWLVFPRASAHCNAFYQKSHISNSLTFYWSQRGSPGSITGLTTQGLECWLPRGPTCSPGFVGLCHAMRIHIKRVLGTFIFWLHPLP